MRSATSRGSPIRPSGISFASSAIAAASVFPSRSARILVNSARRSVAIHPGATAFTRIWLGPSSRASVFTSPTTAARIAFDRRRFSIGCFTLIDVIATMAPPPRAFMEGRLDRTSRTELCKVRSYARDHCSSVNASKRLDGPVHEGRYVLSPGHVRGDSEDLRTGFLPDLLGDRLERALVPRADRDLASLAGQGERSRAAHPLARRGDESDLAPNAQVH